MSFLPTPFTIGHKSYVEGATDIYGDPTDTWSAAVDLAVYAIAPKYSNENFNEQGNSVVTGLTVFAPVSTVGRKDRFVIDGDEYLVDGEIADWTKGPFGWQPGMEITLKRAEG